MESILGHLKNSISVQYLENIRRQAVCDGLPCLDDAQLKVLIVGGQGLQLGAIIIPLRLSLRNMPVIANAKAEFIDLVRELKPALKWG